MKRLLLTSTVCLLLLSCNPECDNALNIRVDSLVKQQMQEIVVMADDPTSLQSSEIQFITNQGVVVAQTKFQPDMGLIVTVPDNIQGENIQLAVNDPDCGTSILGSRLTVGNAAFFANNPSFIPPAPFEFVIPSPPVAFPPLVQNAWVSPQDLDYCIWFKFHTETDNNGNDVIVEIDGLRVPKESVNINSAQSYEYSVEELVCLGNGADANGVCADPALSFYHCNPVSGIIDKENNVINFWIDRTDVNGVNLGIEEFVGEFIDIQSAGYKEEKVPNCAPQAFNPAKNYLMLVTSQTTGRQLLLYQQALL